MLEPILLINDLNTCSLDTIKSRYRDVHAQDASGKSLLFYAVQTHRDDVLSDYVSRGARLSARDDQGETIVFEVIRRARFDLLKKLIALQVDIKQSNDLGQTPLHIAAMSGHVEMIQLLRENDATHQVDLLGKSPIHEAVLNGKLLALKYFVEVDEQSVFILTHDRLNLLHYGVMTSSVDMIEYLIDCDVDMNGLTRDYDTPLHIAVRHQNMDAIQQLLSHFAFMNIMNKFKVTPEDEAQDFIELKNMFTEFKFTPSYENQMSKYQKILAVLNRDKQLFSKLVSLKDQDPFDRYQKKAHDYIMHYQFQSLFKLESS